jgi:hypothetical protein
MTRNVLNKGMLAAASAVTVAAVVAGAWTIQASDSAEAAAPAASWTPGGQLPGVPITVTRPTASVRSGVDAAVAFSSGVDRSSVREVVAGGPFGFGMRLMTARGSAGKPCVSFITDRGGAREFSCFDADTEKGALVRFVGDGGTTLGKVEWVSLVGLARSDVARVTLVTQGGSERKLPLNGSRGFAYSTDVQSGFPASLRAYDAAGLLIEEMPTLP